MNYVCQRLDVPPADAYGVATFYALLSVEPRPPRVAARLRGPRVPLPRLRGADRAARGARRPRGRRRTAACDLVPQPLPRPVRPRAGGDADGRRRAARGAGARAGRRRDALRALEEDAVRARRPTRRCRSTAIRRCGCCGASASVRPTSLDDYRAQGGYAALRRACRARAGGRAARGQGLEAARPRRRRVPDRRQVGRRRAPARPPALPRLQRRRVRAGHVQGPRGHRGRPVLADRGDDHRRLRDELRARLRLPARRVPGRAPRSSARRSRRRAGAASSATTCSARASRSTSRSARAPAPTSAARRPRSSTRSRATAASRATSRRSRWSPGSSASRRWSTTSRRWSTCSTSCWPRRAGLRRAPAPRRSTGTKLFCLSGHVARPGVYEVPFGATLRELLELAGGVAGGRALQTVLLGGAAGGFVRPGRARPAADVRGRAREAKTTLGSGVVLVWTRPSTCRAC